MTNQTTLHWLLMDLSVGSEPTGKHVVTPPNFEQRGSVPRYFLVKEGVEVEKTLSFLPQGGMMA